MPDECQFDITTLVKHNGPVVPSKIILNQEIEIVFYNMQSATFKNRRYMEGSSILSTWTHVCNGHTVTLEPIHGKLIEYNGKLALLSDFDVLKSYKLKLSSSSTDDDSIKFDILDRIDIQVTSSTFTDTEVVVSEYICKKRKSENLDDLYEASTKI